MHGHHPSGNPQPFINQQAETPLEAKKTVKPKTQTAPAQVNVDAWRSEFSFAHIKCLIVCRGPIRLEAIQVLEALGAQPCGILLSEKDSVVYPRALSPELRAVGRNERVHRIPDYAGTNADEKAERIRLIIHIAQEHGYTHLFAGYGFMAEDHEFIAAIEQAGLGFIGPSSNVVVKAGAKDAAKTLARELGVSVTPGIDNLEALTLLGKATGKDTGKAPRTYLQSLIKKHELRAKENPEDQDALLAEAILAEARAKGVELVTVADLQAETEKQVRELLKVNPGKRFRLKHIGGGGGKGQRIVTRPEECADAVFEVLSESNATGPGDNKNFLVELNIETTRHNEIQLLGNGKWCIALGGRDCSLQMHEQKLQEVSITTDMLEEEASEREAQGHATQAQTLRGDARTLAEMEQGAERFGEAVGLDSASTFESIVDGSDHFFMEMNTRIQVEHRVTEMVYALRFTKPDDPSRHLLLESLVEAMVWMAVHGGKLPRPERVPRHGSGVEARINATNDALKPHAGGIVLDWSPSIESEMRDDQGIGLRNPDTGAFMTYHLAGAYDSNITLVVTHGKQRRESFQRLSEILRMTDMRGHDLKTNMDFHYGLLHWMLGADPMIKPTTQFVQAYLAAVGSLRQSGKDLRLDALWQEFLKQEKALHPDALDVLTRKQTLILRPLRMLYARPHLMAGWLAPRAQRRFVIEGGRVVWRQNPIEVLDQLYHYLRLEPHPGVSPEDQIWDHDQAMLENGLSFYKDLETRLGEKPWDKLSKQLASDEPPPGIAKALWARVQASHRGYQLGLALLELPLHTGQESGFYGMGINDRLEVEMPELFTNPATADALRTALEDPPKSQSNQIVAFTGGTFYARPSPDQPPYAVEGQHVEEGDVMGLLEVMKMFNPVRAEFSGTVTRVVAHGETSMLVHKGLPLFELQPDVPIVQETEAEVLARSREKSKELLGRIMRGEPPRAPHL